MTPCKNEKCNEPIFYQSDKIVVEDHEHSWQHYDSINQICHYEEQFKRNEKTIFTVAFFDKLWNDPTYEQNNLDNTLQDYAEGEHDFSIDSSENWQLTFLEFMIKKRQTIAYYINHYVIQNAS